MLAIVFFFIVHSCSCNYAFITILHFIVKLIIVFLFTCNLVFLFLHKDSLWCTLVYTRDLLVYVFVFMMLVSRIASSCLALKFSRNTIVVAVVFVLAKEVP